jgi:hypothetical protein
MPIPVEPPDDHCPDTTHQVINMPIDTSGTTPGNLPTYRNGAFGVAHCTFTQAICPDMATFYGRFANRTAYMTCEL